MVWFILILTGAYFSFSLARIIAYLHPCQGIRVADDLWSGDMRKLPREVVLTLFPVYNSAINSVIDT